MISTYTAFLKPNGVNSYKHPSGAYGKITGVVFVTPEKNSKKRACYKTEWEDGMTDYVPISDVEQGYYCIIEHCDLSTFQDFVDNINKEFTFPEIKWSGCDFYQNTGAQYDEPAGTCTAMNKCNDCAEFSKCKDKKDYPTWIAD